MTSIDIDSLAAWRDAYLKAHTEMKRWEAIKDQAKEKLLDFLTENDAEVGMIQGAPAVQITETRGRFDSKRFARDHPDLYEESRGQAGSRFEVVE